MNLKLSGLALGAAISLTLVGTSTYATDSKSTAKSKPKSTVVTVKAGETLSSIAKKHDTTYVKLFNANKSIKNPDMIDVGDKVRVPNKGEKLPNRYGTYSAAATPTANTSATTATTYTTQQYTTAPVNSSSYYVGNGMWCTDYVQSRRSDVPIYGNAGYNWISAAQADGKATGSTPRAGAVAVTNGHVAYVEKVNADGSYVVSEMGWNYTAGEYNKRTVQPGAFGGFIY